MSGLSQSTLLPRDAKGRPATSDPARSTSSLPGPEPSAGLEAYRAEREKCLALNPRKAANYVKYMASRRRDDAVDYLPIKLDIENVSRCNFRCIMCTASEWPKGKRAEDMSLASFNALLDAQYGLVEIKLQGIGEPLLQGAPYFGMIEAARAQHIWVRTTTNASLLHLKDNARRLLDADPNEIQISVDGADEETFKRIRRQGDFNRVCRNIEALNRDALDRGKRVTKMWTVVQETNRDQLPEVVDLAARLGFRDLVLCVSLTNWGADHWRESNDALSVNSSIGPDEAQALLTQAHAQGIKLGFWEVTQKYSTTSDETLCPWPFERAFIGSDGRVVPCCAIGNPDHYEIGTGQDGFTAEWFGEAYRAFRHAHLSGNVPEVCRHCYE